MRRLAFLFFITSVFMLSACAEPNPDAGSHLMDGSFLDGTVHGPVAKQDLTFCQACHGETGGPGDNPRFNVGINSAGGNGCENVGCHDQVANLAHPQDWAGVNSTFHYSAGSVQQACTLCHGADLDGVGGVGTSCLGCHDDPVNASTLDCIFCHDYPPDGSADLEVPNGVDHSAITTTLAWTAHSECSTCHGMSELAAGGAFDPAANYNLFDKSTDTIGDHWDGNIQMNGDVGYSDTNYGCDSAGCHLNDPVHQLPNSSGLTVVLEGYGTGAVPHPLDGSFLDGSVHGPEAKQDLTVCQGCHGEAGGPGSSPRFNLGISSAGGNGCESCHGVNLAHPLNWAGANSTFHYSAGNVQNACTLCHGASLDGDVGIGSPSCLQCHNDTTAFTLDCTACHNYPPDGTPHAGTINGVDHSSVPSGPHNDCTLCHGMSESAAGGGFEPATNYTLFDYGTDTIGYHWDGSIQMNDDVNYNEATYGCLYCHADDPQHELSDSGLPVVLGNFGL